MGFLKKKESALPNKNATDFPAEDEMNIPDTVEGEMLLAEKLADRAAARLKATKDLVDAHDTPLLPLPKLPSTP